jgi:hypothetical protein
VLHEVIGRILSKCTIFIALPKKVYLEAENSHRFILSSERAYWER